MTHRTLVRSICLTLFLAALAALGVSSPLLFRDRVERAAMRRLKEGLADPRALERIDWADPAIERLIRSQRGRRILCEAFIALALGSEYEELLRIVMRGEIKVYGSKGRYTLVDNYRSFSGDVGISAPIRDALRTSLGGSTHEFRLVDYPAVRIQLQVESADPKSVGSLGFKVVPGEGGPIVCWFKFVGKAGKFRNRS